MTTSIPQPRSPYTQTEQRVGLRLHLSDSNERTDVDGSWWPQSRDLAIELADLVDHFPEQLGEVHRVVFSRPDWDTTPHRVRVARGMVKVGSYPRDDFHQVWLSMSTGQLIRLSVRTPERGPAPAPTLTVTSVRPLPEPPPLTDARDEPKPTREMASEPGSEPGSGPEVDLDAEEEHWTDEGGSWWAPHRGPPSHRS